MNIAARRPLRDWEGRYVYKYIDVYIDIYIYVHICKKIYMYILIDIYEYRGTEAFSELGRARSRSDMHIYICIYVDIYTDT